MLYERLVTQFPTSGRYWRLYIEQEVNIAWNWLLVLMAEPNIYSSMFMVLASVAIFTCYLKVWRQSCMIQVKMMVINISEYIDFHK